MKENERSSFFLSNALGRFKVSSSPFRKLSFPFSRFVFLLVSVDLEGF